MSAISRNQADDRPRVLFVDDSRLMRMCAQKILGNGCELQLATSAEEAWSMLKADRAFQVVFTDLHMGGMSGYDLLRRIRGSENADMAELPVVIITGSEGREEERHHALTLGATDFISKPFQASELTARAQSYADKRRSGRRLRVLEGAHHLDTESGLGNRRYLEERLIQAMSFAERHDQSLVLMHLHLKGLRDLLDSLGVTHSERALIKIGQTLTERVRREDNVFRSADETFSFILPATSVRGAQCLQSRFMPDLEELGLRPGETALDVKAEFRIQEPMRHRNRKVAEIISEGISGNVTQLKRSKVQDADAHLAPSPEEALKLIERGESRKLMPHLDALRERLRPLLEMLNQS